MLERKRKLACLFRCEFSDSYVVVKIITDRTGAQRRSNCIVVFTHGPIFRFFARQGRQ